jgi:hypothetical protein
MNARLTLDLDALSVTTFETDSIASNNVGPSAATVPGCCPNGCNTRLTCSSNLC